MLEIEPPAHLDTHPHRMALRKERETPGQIAKRRVDEALHKDFREPNKIHVYVVAGDGKDGQHFAEEILAIKDEERQLFIEVKDPIGQSIVYLTKEYSPAHKKEFYVLPKKTEDSIALNERITKRYKSLPHARYTSQTNTNEVIEIKPEDQLPNRSSLEAFTIDAIEDSVDPEHPEKQLVTDAETLSTIYRFKLSKKTDKPQPDIPQKIASIMARLEEPIDNHQTVRKIDPQTTPPRYYDIVNEGNVQIALPVRTEKNGKRTPDQKEIIIFTTNGKIIRFTGEFSNVFAHKVLGLSSGGKNQLEIPENDNGGEPEIVLEDTAAAAKREILEELKNKSSAPIRIGTFHRSRFVGATTSVMMVTELFDLDTVSLEIAKLQGDEGYHIDVEDFTQEDIDYAVQNNIYDVGVNATIYLNDIYKRKHLERLQAVIPEFLPEQDYHREKVVVTAAELASELKRSTENINSSQKPRVVYVINDKTVNEEKTKPLQKIVALALKVAYKWLPVSIIDQLGSAEEAHLLDRVVKAIDAPLSLSTVGIISPGCTDEELAKIPKSVYSSFLDCRNISPENIGHEILEYLTEKNGDEKVKRKSLVFLLNGGAERIDEVVSLLKKDVPVLLFQGFTNVGELPQTLIHAAELYAGGTESGMSWDDMLTQSEYIFPLLQPFLNAVGNEENFKKILPHLRIVDVGALKDYTHDNILEIAARLILALRK